MSDALSSAEPPIVRPTGMSVTFDLPKSRRKKNELPAPARHQNYIVYGVDADGNEREYVRHATEEEHKEWEESDPLWKEAQKTIIKRLLDNPKTRDFVIKLNAVAAYEKGDLDTAARLLSFLSSEELDKLKGEVHRDRELDSDTDDAG